MAKKPKKASSKAKAYAKAINPTLEAQRKELADKGYVIVNGKLQRVSKASTAYKEKVILIEGSKDDPWIAARQEQLRILKEQARANHYSECKECGAKVLNSNMRTHKLLHLGKTSILAPNKKFQCDQCGRFFKSENGLATHIQAKHSDNTPVIVPAIPAPVVEKVEEIKIKEKAKPLPKIIPTVSSPEYFSKEAYQIAIKSMPTGEAWKLAKSISASEALLASVTPVEAPVASPVASVQIKGAKVERTIKGRDTADQEAFKQRVRANYSHRCAVTGYALPGLEACHIETHKDHYDNSTDNGLLLEPTLHALFDRGLMIIDAETLTISFKIDCVYKALFEGKKIRQGSVATNKNKLSAKNNALLVLTR